MTKPIVVREYDQIIDEKYTEEGLKYHSVPSSTFEKLKGFVENYIKDVDGANVFDFVRISQKRRLGTVITLRNYVGLIQIDNKTQIEVLPKVAFCEDDDAKTKEVFAKMIKSFRRFAGKVFNFANLKVEKMNLYDVFISMYLEEVRYLVKKGMKSAYETQEDNLRYLKGKLLIKEHQKRNIVHKERFYVAYDEFSLNRPENRLIKSTLLKLHRISNFAHNLKEIKNLLTHFDNVNPSENYDHDFSSVVINSGNREYETIIEWSKIFLKDKSFTTFAGSTKARAILFPMEKVFESYVATEFKKGTRSLNWKVSTQDRGFFLFNPDRFALRPDIVVIKESGEKVILDTKWKSLTNERRKNYGVSQADMYQMYAYAKKYDAKEVYILYPLNEEMKSFSDSPIIYQTENIKVYLSFIDLVNTEESIKSLVNVINESA